MVTASKVSEQAEGLRELGRILNNNRCYGGFVLRRLSSLELFLPGYSSLNSSKLLWATRDILREI